MAFNVRIFGFRGIHQIPSVLPKQYSSDSVYQLVFPYEFSEVLSAGAVAVSSAPVANSNLMLLRVEVADAQTIRFEINPPLRGIAAFNGSPALSGMQQFYFRSGWTISIIDAAGLP